MQEINSRNNFWEPRYELSCQRPEERGGGGGGGGGFVFSLNPIWNESLFLLNAFIFKNLFGNFFCLFFTIQNLFDINHYFAINISYLFKNLFQSFFFFFCDRHIKYLFEKRWEIIIILR